MKREGDGKKRIVYFRALIQGRPGQMMDFYPILILAQPSKVVSSSAAHLRPQFLLMGFFLLGWTKKEASEDELGKEERAV